MDERLLTIDRMIKQSGSWWNAVREKYPNDPPVVYFGDGLAYELECNKGDWRVYEREITPTELSEFDEYVKDVSRALNPKVGESLFDDYRIRAFIKNGRRPGWNLSIEQTI